LELVSRHFLFYRFKTTRVVKKIPKTDLKTKLNIKETIQVYFDVRKKNLVVSFSFRSHSIKKFSVFLEKINYRSQKSDVLEKIQIRSCNQQLKIQLKLVEEKRGGLCNYYST
jgi:hypothetical protein